jgi:hypothetical protein
VIQRACLLRALVGFLAFLGGVALTALLPDFALADDCNLRINPEDCENTAWTIGTVATCAAAAAVIAVLGGSTRPLTAAERREWQARARADEPPDTCEPCMRYCRKVELGVAPGHLRVAHFALSAAGADATWTKRSQLRGEAVDALNEAIVSYRHRPEPDRLRPLAQGVAGTLADAICEWLRSLPGRCDIEVGIHLSGGELASSFTLYHCIRRGRTNIWREEDSWESGVRAERDDPLASVAGLDPSVAEPPRWLSESLTEAIIGVLERQRP